MAGGRGERVDFIDFLDQAGDPSEESVMQRNGADIRVFIGGQVRSIFGGDDAFSLFNFINESYEILYTENANGVFDAILAHVPGNPLQKIREYDQFTCNAAGLVNGMRVRQYGPDRTTVVETMTFSSGVWTKS